MSQFRSVLITGASAGIGRALAIRCAGPDVALAIVGRNEAALAETAEICRSKGARVLEGVFDVRDQSATRRFVDLADAGAPLDLVIANAGVSAGLEPGFPRERPEDARRMLDINVAAALSTVEPALDAMMTRRAGRVALVGSIAALLPLPYSPTYAASKAAIHMLAGAMRVNYAPKGVGISLIVPGFVTTAMSQRVSGWKPFEIDATRAADIIVRGLEAGRSDIVFPRALWLGAVIAAHLPRFIRDFAFRRFSVEVAGDGSAK